MGPYLPMRPPRKLLKRYVTRIKLTAENRRSLYIPAGFAHGFQTLVDDTEVLYQMSEFYHPESARGVRWDDRTLAIRWPIKGAVISPRDRAFPFLDVDPSS